MRRYLALGDSYTIGEGVSDQECWPNQLVALLNAKNLAVGPAHIVARTAWTTDELSDAIDAEGPKGPFDLITLMIGVNDQYRSRPVASFASEFQVLLRRAKKFGGNRATRTIAISIPDWGATPFAEGRDRSLISAEVAAYNSRARELAAAAGSRWVDVTEVSRAMLHDPALVAVDGLHPTAAMYRIWAEHMLPTAVAVLGG
ncbi:MAG: SGNH/GDSL hydrolase family protein [Gemmatimonadaceae bacterium]